MTQRSSMTCDDCGATVIITATDNPRTFVYRCTRCTNRGSICWATAQPPPHFEQVQLPLFSAVA